MRQKKILVVDDEPKVAFTFQQHLELVDKGYIAKAVNSGKEALAELANDHYDLLITDLRMPGIDGLELIRRVRQQSPQTKTILVTAFGSQDVWQEAQRLETFRNLSKPLQIPKLLEAVAEALKPNESNPSGLVMLTDKQFEALAKHTEQLRIDLGARATILTDTTGHVLVYAGNIEGIELSSTMALLGGNMAAASALSRHLNYPKTVHLSFYEGPPYDLYVANIEHHFFLTSIYDRRKKEAGRIGTVWLYTRRAIDALEKLLQQKNDEPAAEFNQSFTNEIEDQLDDLFISDSPPTPKKVVRPTTVARKTSASSSITLHSKITNMLTKFQESTGIYIEQRLDGLNANLSEPAQALILQTTNAALKNIYQYADATIVGVAFDVNGQTLHGNISDNGIGISPEDYPKFRTLKRLSQLFTQLGGQLEVSATPYQGSKLRLQLEL